MEASKRNEYATVKPCSSFDDWFQKNGRPQHLHEPKYQYVMLLLMFAFFSFVFCCRRKVRHARVRVVSDL